MNLQELVKVHKNLLEKKNNRIDNNDIVDRYENPILTAKHTPLFWRYDLNPETNPYLNERFKINATFNAGAIKKDNKYLLVVRVEAGDRKSFFAIAESKTGVDNFQFWKYPITMPKTESPDVNVYDMRLIKHEDGWIYGLFCTEKKDENVPSYDTSSAIANCGIARTKNLIDWERLPDLISHSGQQRNVVLHPEFVNGKYALYTRPQDGFIDTGKGGGIALGYTDSMEKAEVKEEVLVDGKEYHTIKEVKNGLGPAPIKTKEGWLHLAHGVRNTAAGLRYVLYVFMTDLNNLEKVIYQPAGYLIAPTGSERVGDVSNVLFSNGWIVDEDGKIFIYYASSDTRMHVATTTIDRLVDYCKNTYTDGKRSAKSVGVLNNIVENNLKYMKENNIELVW